jgi:copper(I)-binding protein
VTGCARAGASTTSIKLTSAYVIQPTGPGVVDGYLVIQNLGTADRLIAVRSSAGGMVVLRGPTAQDASEIRSVAELGIPGHSLVRLDPASVHLVITRSGPMRQGTDIKLTLVFAHAGTITVAAQVTNFQSGGNTYFGP